MKLPDAEEKRLADVAYDAAQLFTRAIGPDWQLIVRAVLAELPACSPEWATPEAKALLDHFCSWGPIVGRFNLIVDAGTAMGKAWNAHLASLKPKTIALPEDWTLASFKGRAFFVTQDRGEVERACASFEYRVVEHREAREVPAQ